MGENRIKIEATKLVRPWINSSKNLNELFDRVVESCAKNKLSLLGREETLPPKKKATFSVEELERVEEASRWVRKYLLWQEEREALEAPSGTQAFLDQLEEPLPEVGEEGKPLRRKRYLFPTAKTLRKWVKQYDAEKYSLAGNYAACGRRPEVADTVLLSFLCAHAMFPRHSVRLLVEKMKEHEILSKLPGVSISTLRSWGNRIPRGEWDMVQNGEAAHYQSSYGGRPIPAEQPGDLVQVDYGQLKVWTQDPETGARCQPYLMAAIDVRTRAYLGAVLTLKTPTTEETLRLLRGILLPKAGSFSQMLVHPKRVQFDNGSVFNNDTVKASLVALNIDPHFIKLATPTSNGVVERGFRLIGDEFASLYVREVVHRTTWGGKQQVPEVPFGILGEELDEWLNHYNTVRPHSFHEGATPGKVWRELTAGRFYRPDERKIRAAMTLQKECRVNKNGAVEPVKGHLFDGEGMRALVGQQVVVRVTPDLEYDHVHVLVGGDWVKLHSIHSNPGLAKKLAVENTLYKSSLLVVGNCFEVLSGMPRTPVLKKQKAKQKQANPPAPKFPKTTVPKVAESLPKASSINHQPFNL